MKLGNEFTASKVNRYKAFNLYHLISMFVYNQNI